MDRAEEDLQQGLSSNQLFESTNPTMPESPEPTSSLTGFPSLEASTGMASWPQEWPVHADGFAQPLESINEGASLQHQQAGYLPFRHYPPSLLGTQSPPATITSPSSRGTRRGQPESEEGRRSERKHTKRRKTGPDRFDNYLHGDVPLPPNTTTIDVFEKYPNHIGDEDIEECWRIGLSARQISELMPNDTHFNSEGVLVQQHHSLIQKKFKTYNDRHDSRLQSMRDRAAQPEGHGIFRPSTMEATPPHGAPNVGPSGSRNAPPSQTEATIKLPDLKFRHYPFDPSNDQAFEARLSIELNKIEPEAHRPAHEDHEIRILGLLIRKEVQKHGDLLKHRFMQRHPLNHGGDTDPRSEAEGRQYQLQLFSSVNAQRTSLYCGMTLHLLQQSGSPWTHTAGPGGFAEELRLLQDVIYQMYLQSPANPSPPSGKRPIFNFDHVNLGRWRVLARFFYYLTLITRELEDGDSANAASTQPAPHGSIPGPSGRLGEVRARTDAHIMAASGGTPRSQIGSLPVMHLAPTAVYQESSPTSGQQPLYSGAGPSTRTLSSNGPQTGAYNSVTSPRNAGMMRSTYEMAIIGHRGTGVDSAFATHTSHSFLSAATTGNLNIFPPPFAGPAPEEITYRSYGRPDPASFTPPNALRMSALRSPRSNAEVHLPASFAGSPAATEATEVQAVARETLSETYESPVAQDSVEHGAVAAEAVTQDMLSQTEALQPLVPTTESDPAETLATADDLDFDPSDYILFPEGDREAADNIGDLFDWDAFDWSSPGGAETPNNGD